MSSKLFEFCIIKHPSDKEMEDGAAASILVMPTVVLASDESKAMVKAARAIPEEEINNLDNLEICLRPF